MHLSFVFLFCIKISPSEIKDNFSSSEKKVALPFYFLPCLFCCQLSLKMAFFAKARILLNELVLILRLVYLHKWNMKGGKHWSEKITRDQKQTSMKKNVKSGRGTYHTRFSPSAAGWPLKILRWTCRGARPRGSPCSNPCSPPGSTRGILSEIHRPQCRKFAMSDWRGVNEASRVPARALWEQNRDQAAHVFPSLFLNGMPKELNFLLRDFPPAPISCASVRPWELQKLGPLQSGPHPSACC